MITFFYTTTQTDEAIVVNVYRIRKNQIFLVDKSANPIMDKGVHYESAIRQFALNILGQQFGYRSKAGQFMRGDLHLFKLDDVVKLDDLSQTITTTEVN